MLDIFQYGLLGIAAIGGGLINSMAGGGALITFPTLIGLGISPISSNIINRIALCPGYVAATVVQRDDLKGQGRRIKLISVVSIVGTLIGAILLLDTGPELFKILVPFLLALGTILLAVQDKVREWLIKHKSGNNSRLNENWLILPVGIAAIYGGYFGAGLGVISLGILGSILDESFTRINALKQVISSVVNIPAAIFFLFTPYNNFNLWVVLILALGSLIGGFLGGKISIIISPVLLKWIVVAIGTIISVYYFIELF